MALSAGTIFEVQTGGSDTLNSGFYDPSQTAGMIADFAVASANTSAPVVTSATYNFVAGDVGHWFGLWVGTNGVFGWYKIASVAANAATLNAAIGAAVLAAGVPSTAVGCSASASLTSQTGSIDYSQVASVPFSLTGLTTAAANAIILTASAGKIFVGNGIQITGGTNFTTGFYVITAATAGVSMTVDRNCTSAAGAAGTAGLGGALASPGQAGALVVSGSSTVPTIVWMPTGTFSVTSASTNVAGGCVNVSANTICWIGYGTVRGDFGSRPTWQASGISTFTLWLAGNNSTRNYVANIIFDANSLTGGTCCSTSNTDFFYKCKAMNFKSSGFVNAGSSGKRILCEATGGTGGAGFNAQYNYGCIAYGNTVTGFLNPLSCTCCISVNNTGASSDGFSNTGIDGIWNNCTAYGNGRDGFRSSISGAVSTQLINCIAENNSGYGFNLTAAFKPTFYINCGGYNNTSGLFNTTNIDVRQRIGTITGTAEIFTNAAGNDFSLNNNAGGGALFRAAGIPGAFPPGISTTGYLDVGAVQHLEALVKSNRGILIGGRM